MTAYEFRDIYNNIIPIFGNHLLLTIIANGANITETGVIEKTTDSGVALRTDSGQIRFYPISSIVSIGPASESVRTDSEARGDSTPNLNADAVGISADASGNDQEKDREGDKTSIERSPKCARKDYTDEIRCFMKENRDAWNKSNQITNILNSAKKNHALQEKESKICVALKEFLNNFGENRFACFFAADVYEQLERYEDAIAIYKCYGELNNAKFCASKSGDVDLVEKVAPFTPRPGVQTAKAFDAMEVTRHTGRIDIWDKAGIYGFLWSDEKIQGKHKIFFHLSSVIDEELRAYLYKLSSLPRTDIRVAFILGDNNGELAATRIEGLETAQVIQSSQCCVGIIEGFLTEYNKSTEFGWVSDGTKEYSFFPSACRDPDLRNYFKDEYRFHFSNIDVYFTLKKYKGKNVVDKMMATESGRKQILSELGDVAGKSKFENKTVQEILRGIDPTTDLSGMPGYRELPPWREANTHTVEIESLRKDTAVVADQGKDPLADRKLYAPKVKNPCQQGLNLEQSAPDKAEKYFLDALQKGDRVETALPSLISLYNRVEGDPCIAGFPLLDYYGIHVDPEKRSNLRISMLQKARRHDELVTEIDKVLPTTYNLSKRKHFLYTKALSLNKLERYRDSIMALENYKKLALSDGNHTAVLAADRLIAMNYYLDGKHEQAKQLAEKILKINAKDSIASAIVHDELQQIGASDLPEFDNLNIEDDQQLKGYPKYKVDSIILDTQIAGAFRGYISDNKIVGDLPNLSKAFARYIAENIRRMSAAAKDDGWAFLAKAMLQILEEHTEDTEETLNRFQMSYKNVNLYAGRAMMSSGDYVALSLENELDTLRFFYTQTLNLVPEDQNDAINAFNRMVCSFYAARDELAKIVQNAKETESACWEYAGNHRCGSLRSLFITTFLLDSRANQRIRKLLGKLLQNKAEDRENVLSFGGLREMYSRPYELSADEYYNRWLVQKNDYLKWKENLQRNINQLNSDFTSIEAIEGHIVFLQNALEEKKLLSLDEGNIGKLVSTLESLHRASSTDDFDAKEDIFKSILVECESLENTIEKSPTSLSFEFVREVVNGLKVYAIEKLDELYSRYCPELSLTCTCGYQTSGNMPIYFNIRNKYNRQTAEILSIDFSPTIEGFEIKKNDVGLISRVKSGEAPEGMRTITFDPDCCYEYVEFDMKVTYRFSESHETKGEQTISRAFHFELRDRSQFMCIENPYRKYALGGAVVGDLFRGRDGDIGEIISMLKDGEDMLTHRGIVMYGQKRAGKSSILENLRASIQQAYGEDTYLFIEIGSIGDIAIYEDKISGIFSKFLSGIDGLLRKHPVLYRRLQEDGVDLPAAKREITNYPKNAAATFNRVFDVISRKLEEYGGRNRYIPMFFVDEFTYIYEWIKKETDSRVKGFPHFWKAFLQNHRVCSIITGQDNMPAFTHMPEYANDFGCMKPWRVTYLEEIGARELIEDPIRKPDGASRFNEDAIQMMLRWTAGSAYLIVFLCDKLVGFMNESCHENVTALVLTQFLKKLLVENQQWELIFDAQTTDPSKVLEEAKKTADDNKILLSYIACNADERGGISKERIDYIQLSEPTREYRDRLLEALIRRDVLVSASEQDHLKIKVDLLRIVLRSQAGLDVEEIR